MHGHYDKICKIMTMIYGYTPTKKNILRYWTEREIEKYKPIPLFVGLIENQDDNPNRELLRDISEVVNRYNEGQRICEWESWETTINIKANLSGIDMIPC